MIVLNKELYSLLFMCFISLQFLNITYMPIFYIKIQKFIIKNKCLIPSSNFLEYYDFS